MATDAEQRYLAAVASLDTPQYSNAPVALELGVDPSRQEGAGQPTRRASAAAAR